MIDLDVFLRDIKHAVDNNGYIEKANCQALEIDDDTGLACFLDYSSGEASKVDYCLISENKKIVQLIELTDLKKKIFSLKTEIALELQNLEENLTVDERQLAKNTFVKKMWTPVVMEFKLKYNGSMAIIERLYRRNNIVTDPSCQLLIVCKDKTDIRMLDGVLVRRLKGLIRTGVSVCETKNACAQLLSLN